MVYGVDDITDQIQQPLTALRLMVEGLQRGIISHSPELHGSLLTCVLELQQCVDAMNGVEQFAE